VCAVSRKFSSCGERLRDVRRDDEVRDAEDHDHADDQQDNRPEREFRGRRK
jgi:hypothetical protein